MEEDYLLQIQKPARYIGAEWNVSKKDFDTACVKVALCFPDLYEVGMSNLGVRILYGVLNAQEGVVCERFFSYAVDMEALARSLGLGLVSLESRRRLNEFDIAGFSLSHELSYTNVLAMLELGGVPLRSSQRDHAHPLVIAGGPCTLNPEPMHDFFDAFVIGEAEEAVQEITALYQKHRLAYKQGALSKEDLLIMLTQIEGIYV
ncbi:MAG: B12-binding domain-containing radical SAM protein, partial [Candidatus Omnitrophica bacterium]|nr:B12-binding domain-containing radical SAM protein [Candidatus Omnitrophota bacterium]